MQNYCLSTLECARIVHSRILVSNEVTTVCRRLAVVLKRVRRGGGAGGARARGHAIRLHPRHLGFHDHLHPLLRNEHHHSTVERNFCGPGVGASASTLQIPRPLLQLLLLPCLRYTAAASNTACFSCPLLP